MSSAFPALDVFKVEASAETRDRHLAAISEALTSRRRRSSRKLLVIAIATVLLLPVVAFAAEQAGPGDLLYPLKRALVEPVVSIFDSDVVAVHRVEEVEDLFAHEAELDVIKEHIVMARDVVVDSPDLMERLDRIEDAVQERAAADVDRQVDEPAVDDAPPVVEEPPVATTIPASDTTVPEDPPPRDGGGDRGDDTGP